MLQWWEEFSKHPWVAHVLRTVERFNVRGGPLFAAAIAYFSVLSLVPVLMLAFSVLGYVLTVFNPVMLSYIDHWLQTNLTGFGDLGKTVLGVITNSLGNWAAIGLIGLAIAFWTGANWIGNLKRASRALMRTDYDNPPRQAILPLELLINFGALLVLFVGIAVTWVAATAATVLGKELGDWLGTTGLGWSLLLRGVSLIISLGAGTLLFWWMFRWFALNPVPRRLLWIGAGVGAVGLVILQTLAGYLIGAFSRNLTASLFGPVIILMLFMNLFSTLILYVAAWLATAVPDASVAEPEPVSVAEPEPVESRPGELHVSSEVARRSMGVGLATGYTVGTATGLGLGALLAAALGWVFGRRD